MTLSYRWSLEPSILLLSSNFHEFRRGVHFELLTQLFRDFITVARRFRIRYVWIDSLCIIQDSQEDWEREAPKMRYVYSGSICNVAASASSTSEHGMFRRRTAKDVRPGLIEIASEPSGSRYYYIFDKSYWDRHLRQGPLLDRGWVFQEIILAPRVIYFSNSQILWECLSEHKCEGFPHGVPLHDSGKNMDPLLPMQLSNEVIGPLKMSYDSIDLWMDLVAKYSSCDLTRPEDKLWAFSGIAKFFQGNATGQYYAGLWESRLLEMMDWRVHVPASRLSPTYRAPSWSWASVDGPIHPTKPHNQSSILPSIIEAKTDSIGDPLGGIYHGSLRLKGPLLTAKFQAKDMPVLRIHVDSELITGQCFVDNDDIRLDQDDDLVILLLRLQQVLFESGGESWELVCIMLQCVGNDTRSFRRTGILVFRNEEDQRDGIVERIQTAATECEIELL
jgi:hypothetical protein